MISRLDTGKALEAVFIDLDENSVNYGAGNQVNTL